MQQRWKYWAHSYCHYYHTEIIVICGSFYIILLPTTVLVCGSEIAATNNYVTGNKPHLHCI